MKSITMLKILGVCAVSSLSLITSTAQADSCPSSVLSPSVAPYVGAYPRHEGLPLMNQADTRMAQEMARIESALRTGQITPYQAGRLMRAQWELSQFQRGFSGKGPEANRSTSCGLNQDAIATLVPLVGNMAKGGIQTASTVMNALVHEVSRLIQEQAQADELTPF